MTKYVVITGGVVSGIGKGITAASLGALLKARGYKVTLQKFDPYFNVDSSNLSPYQHGEVFVTDDGAETDLVIGHYERFIDECLTGRSDITSGRVYSNVISNEREGKYDGSTVQVVPHITDEIRNQLLAPDDGTIVIVDVGGTVGDIECNPFLEAFKQLRVLIGSDNIAYVHVSYVPFIEMSGEQKTKPTQHSVKELQNVGIQPDVIVCRSDYPLEAGSKKKMAAFCNVRQDCIIENLTTDNILAIPLELESEGFASAVLRKLKLEDREADLTKWEKAAKAAYEQEREKKVRIAVVGKYVEMHDAYVSLFEALRYSGYELGVDCETTGISSDRITERNVAQKLAGYDGIIIPAGFGERGFAGKIACAGYAREHDVPCLMIGLGAHAGVAEFARSVLGMKDADSREFDKKTSVPVICEGAVPFKKGAHRTSVVEGTLLHEAYGAREIFMRHRHRYEMNPDYAAALSKSGMLVSGISDDGYIDAYELPVKKFFVGTAFQPEFNAKVGRPDKLITLFLSRAVSG